MSFKDYKRHGITEKTVENLFIGAGAIYINFGEEDERILGATSGGSNFSIEQEIRYPEIDGARGPIKGAPIVVESVATLTVNLIEITAENVKLALAGSDIENYGETYKRITRSRQITAEDYIKNIALVGTLAGSREPVVCLIENALATGGFSLQTVNKEEAGVEVVFTGHYDPANMDKEPWDIIYPGAVEVPENPEG